MSFRKLFIYIFIFLLLAIVALNGSVFDAVQPGKSKKADLQARFGEPVRTEEIDGLKIDHFNDEEKLFREVSAWFNAREVLQVARVRPFNEISADNAPLLFGLSTQPDKAPGNVFDLDGTQPATGETWHYRAQGICFFVKDGIVEEIWLTLPDIDPGQVFSLLKSDMGQQMQQDKQKVNPDPNTIDQVGGRTPYLGAAFLRHDGEGIKIRGILDNTPAQHSGLRKGDLILKVENISFRDIGAQPELFADLIKELPVDKPVRFLLERDGKKIEIWIKLLNITEDERAVFQERTNEKFRSDYDRGQELFSQDKYSEAIKAFRKSMGERPLESNRSIGICYMYQNRFKVALDYIVKAYKMNKKSPESTFYLAACCDNLNKVNNAKYYYKAYLKMKHDNPEWNTFAQNRLNNLNKKNKGRDFSKTLLRIIRAVQKEIKK